MTISSMNDSICIFAPTARAIVAPLAQALIDEARQRVECEEADEVARMTVGVATEQLTRAKAAACEADYVGTWSDVGPELTWKQIAQIKPRALTELIRSDVLAAWDADRQSEAEARFE